MIQAYVSGSAGLALGLSGGQAYLLEVGITEPKPIDEELGKSLILNRHDCLEIAVQGDLRQVSQRLHKEKSCSDSLLLFITLFDQDASIETKILINSELNETFSKYHDVYEYISSVMFSKPLGLYESKVLDFLENAVDSEGPTRNLLKLLTQKQDEIIQVDRELKQLFEKFDLDGNERNLIEGFLTHKRVQFECFSNSMSEKTLAQLISFELVQQLKSMGTKNSIPLTNNLKGLFKKFCNRNNAPQQHRTYVVASEFSEEQRTEKEVRKSQIPAYQIKESVDTQIKAIFKKLKSGNLNKANELTDSLIGYQLANGGSEYAALSLCRLSEKAKKYNFFKTQLRWAKKATEIAPEDYRAHGHVADAYIHLEDFESALRYLDTCSLGDFDNHLYSLLGKARIYKEKHELDSALDFAKQAEKFAPKNPNALAIKAEVLRAKGLYEPAINAYKDVQRHNYEEPRGWLGEASILADLKRYDDSVALYERALELYPNDRDTHRIANCALAFIYAKRGRFLDADKHIELGFKASKFEDVVTDLTYSRILNLNNKAKLAISFLYDTIKTKPHFYELRRELIGLLNVDGRCDEAFEVYEALSEEYKNVPSVRLRHALTYKHKGAYKEALQVLDSLKKDCPKYVFALTERAKLLKSMEDLSSARSQYNDVLKISPKDAKALLGIQYLNALEGKSIHSVYSDNNDCQSDSDIDRVYESAGNAIIELLEDTKLAKKNMLKAKNSKLNLKGIFGVPIKTTLSLASLYENKLNAAFKYVKKVETVDEALQKAIILGEQGKKHLIIGILNRKGLVYSPHTEKVKQLIVDKYLNAKNEPMYDLRNLLKEQIKTVLLAA